MCILCMLSFLNSMGGAVLPPSPTSTSKYSRIGPFTTSSLNMCPRKAVLKKRGASGARLPWPKHTLVLKNTGLVARDHLANERTYLAWTRTALVLLTLGLAFLQLYSIQLRAHEAVYRNIAYEMDSAHGTEGLRTTGKPFGVLIGVFALLIVGIGFYRYLAVQQALRHNEFPASRFLVAAVLAMCGVLMVLILVMDIKSL